MFGLSSKKDVDYNEKRYNDGQERVRVEKEDAHEKNNAVLIAASAVEDKHAGALEETTDTETAFHAMMNNKPLSNDDIDEDMVWAALLENNMN